MAAPTAEQSADRAVAALVRLAHTAFHVLGVAAAHPVTDASLAEATYFVGGEVPATHLLRQAVAHKRAFSEFVLAYVRLPLTPVLYKRVLMVVQAQIMPHMTDARLLMGFLNESYQRGGSVGVLALHGLFTLIVRHNLDYPDFYTKLYALFDRDLLHVKYRSRFLRLFVIFMQSTHIPAYLVAAFLKRLARLCLHAPPAAVLAALPIMYNLIKRHPATFVLIHRDGLDASAAAREDVFDMDATDPAKARALESSLWELTALQRHYFPNVATLAKVFSEKMTKPGWEVEEFLDYTYGNVCSLLFVTFGAMADLFLCWCSSLTRSTLLHSRRHRRSTTHRRFRS
ncbi:CBF/Mak21 family-domain-containing protein [Blastocladiella britannica]|nr:CBF/Mak21 family-domain-containing protein [Blastocladiella britannica]